MGLLGNDVSHWPGASLESALLVHDQYVVVVILSPEEIHINGHWQSRSETMDKNCVPVVIAKEAWGLIKLATMCYIKHHVLSLVSLSLKLIKRNFFLAIAIINTHPYLLNTILPGIILWMSPANERRCYRYIVMLSLIGWAHIWNDPVLGT